MGSQVPSCGSLNGCKTGSCRVADRCRDASLNNSSFPYFLGSRDFILQGYEKPVPKRFGRNVALGNISVLDQLESGNQNGLKVVKSTTSVLVSDLSGFTTLIREHGIIHFASIAARMRQICYPIVNRRGCFHQSTEGDKMIVAFTNVAACVKAALEMQHAIRKHNSSLSEKSSQWRIDLNGVGVHCGYGLVIDEDGHVFGDSFSLAAHLCEDWCNDGRVLISEDVLAAIASDPFFGNANFHQLEKDLSIYEVQGSVGPLLYEEVSTDDASCIPPCMVTLCLRHNAGKGLIAIDRVIHEQLVHQFAVLVLNLNLKVTSCKDVSSVIIAKRHAMELIIPIMQKHGGRSVEPMIWMFKSSTAAVHAAVEGKTNCEAHNALTYATKRSPIEILGWGIHEGPLLCLHGTDMHWGDPVSTASKLGLDLAENGDILVMPEVKSILKEAFADGDDQLLNYYFEKRTLTPVNSSGDFCYYCVHTTNMQGGTIKAYK